MKTQVKSNIQTGCSSLTFALSAIRAVTEDRLFPASAYESTAKGEDHDSLPQSRTSERTGIESIRLMELSHVRHFIAEHITSITRSLVFTIRRLHNDDASKDVTIESWLVSFPESPQDPKKLSDATLSVVLRNIRAYAALRPLDAVKRLGVYVSVKVSDAPYHDPQVVPPAIASASRITFHPLYPPEPCDPEPTVRFTEGELVFISHPSYRHMLVARYQNPKVVSTPKRKIAITPSHKIHTISHVYSRIRSAYSSGATQSQIAGIVDVSDRVVREAVSKIRAALPSYYTHPITPINLKK